MGPVHHKRVVSILRPVSENGSEIAENAIGIGEYASLCTDSIPLDLFAFFDELDLQIIWFLRCYCTSVL